MEPDTPCAKCGSTSIIPRARVLDRADHTEQDLQLSVKSDPDAWIMTGEEKSAAFARVCADCGFVELFAEHPRRMLRAYLTSIEPRK